jgi:2Fe-2S ferredoxin
MTILSLLSQFNSRAKFALKMKYKVTFLPENKTVEVDSDQPPVGRTGLPGSVLNTALNVAKIDIEHTCGGVAACSTCHVIIEKGFESCNEASDSELDQLDNAPDTTLKSRLSCQCIPSGKTDLVVRIPSWNRNFVKETPH